MISQTFFRLSALFALIAGFFTAPLLVSAATLPIPDDVQSTEIGQNVLGNGWEPSGIVWHEDLQAYVIVSDDGVIGVLTEGGALLNTWSIGGDLEAVTYNPATGLAYVANESNGTISEFDLTSGSLTGNTWNVQSLVGNPSSNLGIEAMTFVPDGVHPHGSTDLGGVMYIGTQSSFFMFVIELDDSSSRLDLITLPDFVVETSGLSYDPATGYIVSVHDSYDLGRVWTPSGAMIVEIDLPGDNQEGVATRVDVAKNSAQITITEDAGSGASEIWKYDYELDFFLPEFAPIEEGPDCVAVPANTSSFQYQAMTDCEHYVESDGRYVRVYDQNGNQVAERKLYRKTPAEFDLHVTDLYSDGTDDILIANVPPIRQNGRLYVLQFDGTSLKKKGHARLALSSSDRTPEFTHADDGLGTVIVTYGPQQVLFWVSPSGRAYVELESTL